MRSMRIDGGSSQLQLEKNWRLGMATAFTIAGVGIYQIAAPPNPERLVTAEIALGGLVGASSALFGYGIGKLIDSRKSARTKLQNGLNQLD